MIAVFYTAQVHWAWLGLALVPLAALVAMNLARVEEPVAYFAVGGVLWFAFLSSGVHATIAGVIAAFTIPAVARIRPLEFTEVCRARLAEIERIDVPGAHTLEDDRQQEHALGCAAGGAAQHRPAPAHRVGPAPVRDLRRAARLRARERRDTARRRGPGLAVSLGVLLGLVAGKPAGIALAAWIAVRTGFADLPAGVGWRHILGAGALAGIGFTMSLFVANLAFGTEVARGPGQGRHLRRLDRRRHPRVRGPAVVGAGGRDAWMT